MGTGLAPRVVVVQARLESHRRPGKGLALIGEKTLVSRVLERSLKIEGIHQVILATTVRDADNILVDHVREHFGTTLSVLRGSSEDVQSRFVDVAKNVGPCLMGRVTADDPFKDPELYAQGFDLLESSGADYVSVGTKPIPLGMDIEVFTSDALLRSRKLYPNAENREHVTIEMTRRPEFIREKLSVPSLLGNGRLTVDFEEDIRFASLVAEAIVNLGGALDHTTTLAAVHEAAQGAKERKK